MPSQLLPLPASQEQNQAHNMFALVRQVGVDGDRGRVLFVVQHDISGRGPTFDLGPAAAKTGFDFVENLPVRGNTLICGLEPLRIASVSPRSVERTVSPTGKTNFRIQKVASARSSNDADKLVSCQRQGGDSLEFCAVRRNFDSLHNRSG